MDHQQIFPTNLFIQDDFLAPQRLPALKNEILSLYEKRKPNWQTGPDLDKTEPFKWFAKDVSKEVFKSIDAMDYQADTIEITSMWGNVLKPGETHQPHSHSNGSVLSKSGPVCQLDFFLSYKDSILSFIAGILCCARKSSCIKRFVGNIC